MNPRYKKVIEAMKGYDSSPIGSPERFDFALQMEKLSKGGWSEREIAQISCEYEKAK